MNNPLSLPPKRIYDSGGRFLAKHLVGITILAMLLSLITATNISIRWGDQQFSYLALSFLHGQLAFLAPPGSVTDLIVANQHLYWALGPFPAILLIPFVYVGSLTGMLFPQGYLQWVLVTITLFLIVRIAERLGFSRNDACYAAFAFVGASAMLDLALVPWSWYFAQIVTVTLVVYALSEFFGKRRPILIGSIMALVLMTRATAGLGILFFILEELWSNAPWPTRLRRLLALLIPIALAIILLVLYNYLRFGVVWESGYHLQMLNDPWATARSYGTFGLVHLPGNLYHLFLAGPKIILQDGISHVLKAPYLLPDLWGMSIFITSPYYLLLAQNAAHTKREKFLWLTVVVVALPILLYYGIGYVQIGYRYALDFLPFLFILFLIHYRQHSSAFSRRLKILFILTFFVNFYWTLAWYSVQ